MRIAALICVILLPLPLSGQDRPSARGKTTPAPVCFNTDLPTTPMGIAVGYVEILKRAAAAESLTRVAFSDTAPKPGVAFNLEGRLAEVFYNLDAASREYACAGQVLDPFRTQADSNTREFVIETQDVFGRFSGWLADVRANYKRRMGGNSAAVVDEAERLAELRRRREALTQLLGLNSAGLSYLLMEPNRDSTYRLALTTSQRDSLTTMLRAIGAGSTADPPAVANILLKWLSDSSWATR